MMASTPRTASPVANLINEITSLTSAGPVAKDHRDIDLVSMGRRVDKRSHFLIWGNLYPQFLRHIAYLQLKDHLAASAGLAAATVASSSSQYFSARFARSAHSEVRSRSRYRVQYIAASA